MYISDLHIGDARAKDLWPDHDRTDAEQREIDKLVDTDYIQKFTEFVSANNITADYLVLPGDMSQNGEHAQLELASSVIERVAEALKIGLDNVVYVPGNHDPDWEMMRRRCTTDFYKNLRYIAFQDENLVFGRIGSRSRGDVLAEPCFSVWDHPDITVVGYNSSWEDEPKQSPHHGSIREEHLKQLRDYLRGTDLSGSRVKLFLVHHHLFHHSDPDPNYQDFSVMRNAEHLLELLRAYKFDLVIHGHKHWPKFGIDNTNLISPIAILGAGSFSAQIYPGWEGKVNNQFHIVEVEGRDSGSETVFGHVYSWTYLAAHGWVPSEERNGIAHKSPFGSHYQAHEVQKTLRPFIESELAVNSVIRWSEIVTKLPHLAHLNDGVRKHVLNELSESLNFICHPMPDDLFLAKIANGRV